MTEPTMLSRQWISRAAHRAWLRDQANGLLAFFEAESRDPKGGFFELDEAGRPLRGTEDSPPAKQIHTVTRLVHCFAAADLLGRPGAAMLVDHGMRFLWERHRDRTQGGYYWS